MKIKERVTVDLNHEAKNGPPIKYTKIKKWKPDAGQFKFVPKAFPQLQEALTSHVSWNSVSKTITFYMTETPTFEVCRWIDYTNDQYSQIQKSPFIDIDTNSATLTFFGENQKETATIKFKNLQVTHHNCTLFKNSSEGETIRYLTHNLTLTYQYAEMAVLDDEEDDNLTDNEKTDKEWQTVETP